MEEIVKWLLSPKPYICIGTVIVAMIIWFAMKRFVKKLTGNSDKKDAFAAIILNIVKYLLAISCVLVILQVNGVNVSSAIAGLGIVSVIVGLSLQDGLKDIIMGVNIISENFFRVGDVVKIGDYVGRVSTMTLKSTRLVNGEEGYEVRICNRNIDKVMVYNDLQVIDIPLSYREKSEKVQEVMDQIVKDLAAEKDIRKAEFLGIQEYLDSAIKYRIRVFGPPAKRASIRRKVLKTVDRVLRENNISIPFPQLDIHQDK
ncbi:MAG: mechanosensitive ion channel family protein [Clostridiales bacterium]|nr:mechanosensitive ion channel family protein [Clostridiales bacterium]